MKITFFIGNGYDINIGLKTGFPDFLKWYIAQPNNNELIVAFKQLIEGGIDYWSDLEVALGQKTLNYPLNTRNSFKICKTDLDKQVTQKWSPFPVGHTKHYKGALRSWSSRYLF